MIDEQSRAGEYLSRAAEMRQLARNTRFPEVRTRLLLMAAGFERLADQVERWEGASLATAADSRRRLHRANGVE
jgi:hypothetical protein